MSITIAVQGDLHIHLPPGATAEQLAAINLKLEHIAMTNDELIEKINAMTAQGEKVATEIQHLIDVSGQTPDVPQAVQDAVARLAATLQKADDLNPDAPT